MSEIKTPLKKLDEGESYVAGSDDYVISEEHTFADIIRFLIEMGCDKDDAIELYEDEE